MPTQRKSAAKVTAVNNANLHAAIYPKGRSKTTDNERKHVVRNTTGGERSNVIGSNFHQWVIKYPRVYKTAKRSLSSLVEKLSFLINNYGFSTTFTCDEDNALLRRIMCLSVLDLIHLRARDHFQYALYSTKKCFHITKSSPKCF